MEVLDRIKEDDQVCKELYESITDFVDDYERQEQIQKRLQEENSEEEKEDADAPVIKPSFE